MNVSVIILAGAVSFLLWLFVSAIWGAGLMVFLGIMIGVALFFEDKDWF